MTSFLTFSVTAVRISDDIPTQSEYLPLVTLYMMLSMIYTFIGMLFFILIESFSKNKNIPGGFLFIPILVQKLIDFKRNQVKVRNNNRIVKEKKSEIINEPEEHSKLHHNRLLELPLETKTMNDEIGLDKEDEKVKKNGEKKLKTLQFEKDISILNIFFSIILWSFVITSNIVIWFLIIN